MAGSANVYHTCVSVGGDSVCHVGGDSVSHVEFTFSGISLFGFLLRTRKCRWEISFYHTGGN